MYTFLSCYPRKAIRGCESVFGHHTWTKTPDNTDVHTLDEKVVHAEESDQYNISRSPEYMYTVGYIYCIDH